MEITFKKIKQIKEKINDIRLRKMQNGLQN